LPVIVDAAAALPPAENLRRLIAAGADLVSFSGGKALRGPQASGILCGRRDLIASVLLQHQDMDVHPEAWSFRSRFLDSGLLPGPPHQGLGRGFKVGKEEIAGLVAALRSYVKRDHAADRAHWARLLQTIVDGLAGLPHVRAALVGPATRAVPAVQIDLDEEALGRTAFDIIAQLLDGTPRVAVNEGRARAGGLLINALALAEADIAPLVGRLRAVLGGG
jgi:D-glucosaminate-6-phosphate ammonia-lyase